MKRYKVLSMLFTALLAAVFSREAGLREVWSRSFLLEADATEIGSDIKVDNIKNSLYVTGLKCVKEGANNRGIVAVRKIDLEGNELWKQVCDIGVGGFDETNAIAVDNNNNVCIAGYRYIEGKGKNPWIRKYDQNGGIIWDKTYENLYDSRDAGFKEIAVDAEGNIYAAGYKYTDEIKRDLWIRKYDPRGTELWKDIYCPGNTLEEQQGLAVDPEGSACVAAYAYGENAEYLLTIKKYDKAGRILLARQYPEDKLRARSMNKLALDSTGNIYMVGSEQVFYQGRNIFVRKFDAGGLDRWTKTYTNTGYERYAGNNIMVDRDLQVYVSATGGGGKNDQKYSWLSGLDKEGNELWVMNYTGYSYGVKFTVHRSGSIYVLGTETDKNKNSNIWVKKYVQEPKN